MTFLEVLEHSRELRRVKAGFLPNPEDFGLGVERLIGRL